MKYNPAITVGIVTRNRLESLLRSIQSVYSQGFDDVEILVVDNASEDGTAETLRRDYPDVQVIRLPENVGCPAGRNYIFNNSRGDYIVNLDDDGWLGEEALEHIMRAFKLDSRIGVVGMRLCFPDEERSTGRNIDKNSLIEIGLFMGGVSTFRRRMLDEIGLYPGDFFFLKEEEFLALRVIDAGYRIVFCPGSVMWHPRYGPSKRMDIAWDYYRFRNPLLVVIRLFPGWLMMKYFILRMGAYFLMSLRRGSFHTFLIALCNVLWQMPKTLLKRTPCSREAVKKYLYLRESQIRRSSPTIPNDSARNRIQ